MNIGGHGGARRVALVPGYVLHHHAYRDSSRIVEAFTAEHGRLTLFARGANSPKSPVKGVLQPFQRLLLSFTSRGEAGALVGAEPDGSRTMLPACRLMSGFYINELLLRLTERWDPHPEIFRSYAACVEALGAGTGEEAALRRFEKGLLHDLGYGLELTRTGAGVPVEPDRYYRMAALQGPEMCVAETPGAVYGRSLTDLASGSFADSRSLRDAKRVLRTALDACLDGRALKSRAVMLAMRQHAAPRGAAWPADTREEP